MQTPLKILLTTRRWTASRFCSSYVARVKYMNQLKENDEACLAALQTGNIFLYHKLAPLLQPSEKGLFRLPTLQYKDLEGVLRTQGSGKDMVKDSVLIGCTEDSQPQFCLDVGELDREQVEKTCEGMFMDLRKAFFVLRGAEAPLVAKGQALLRWHQDNRYCSATGQPTHKNQSGSQRVCHTSGVTYYPKMAPVVIVLVSDGKRCLLGRQSTFPAGMYSALAGFCDMGETLEETLRREVAEEVGLEVETIRYSGSQHWPFPQSSFMVACHATVHPDKSQVVVDHTELEDARWFSLDEITAALSVKRPPRTPKGQPAIFWVPPKYAIANQLIREWAANQHKT